MVLLAGTNTPESTARLAAQTAIWTAYALGLAWFLRSRPWRVSIAYLSLTIDHGVVGATYFATAVNHAGVVEYWRGGVLLAFALWNLMAGLRLNPAASLYSAGLTVVVNSVLLGHTVRTGAAPIVAETAFAQAGINVQDQLMMIVFVALPGVVAAILASRSRGLIVQAAMQAERRQELQAEQERLGKYLPRQVVELLVRDPNRLPFAGDRREVTVVFVDIRDYTRTSQHMSPEETVAMLNRFFEAMVSVVFAYGGTLDKFLGDGFMAVFGAPLPTSHAAHRAAAAAVDLVIAARRIDTVVGISMATGEVLSGAIGSAERMEFTCIGPPVNLASRLEPLNKRFSTSIIMSQATRDALPAGIPVEDRGEVAVRGLDAPIRVWTLDPDAVDPEKLAELRERFRA